MVIDNWWSSESGSPISGIALSAAAGKDFNTKLRHTPLPIRPGSAGEAIPGFDVRIVDDDGNELQPGSMGNVVMATPLAPTAFTTLWNDENRFYRSYLRRFNGKWIDTGDAGMIDKDGYISIMSRSSTSLLIDSAQLSCRRQPVFDNRINFTRRY